MALALEGFSIREYVANTRSIDFNKCWPFGGGGDRSLPEISIRRFRFWNDETKAEEVPMARTPAKGKQRTPKKRSIVELFAAVPPIETAEADDIDKDEESKGKGDIVEIKKKKLMKGKLLKRGKKRLIKGKISKPTSSSHIFHKLQDSKHKVLSRKNSNPVDSKKKSVFMKNLPKNRKLKLQQSSKQISTEKREPGKILQVHCILKNPTRGTTKKAGAKTSTEGGNLVDSCRGSEELVTFLGKDDTLAHAKSCSSIDNTCKGDNLPAANDMAQAEKISDINASSDIVNRSDETSAEKEKLFESHNSLMPPIYKYLKNTSCSDVERASFSISEDCHQSMQGFNDGCHFTTGTKTTLASDPQNDQRSMESFRSVGLSSLSDIRVKEISLKTHSRFDPAGSLSLIKNLSPLKETSCSIMRKEKNKMQPQPPIVPLTNSYRQILPPKDFRFTVGSNFVSNPAKNSCIVDGFVGLPLNSQGELIHSQSGASFDFGEITRKQNVAQGSNHGYPVPHNAEPRTSLDHVNRMKGKFANATLSQKVQPSWFQGQYSFGNSRNFDGFAVQSNNETLANKCPSFLRDDNIMELSCHGCRDDKRTRNYIDRVNFQGERNIENMSRPNSQQTMRLMGTNVTVSGNNRGCQSYGDGRIWVDKEVLTDHFGRDSDQPMQNTYPSSTKPKNNLVRPLDTSSNFYSMPAITPKLGLMHFNYRPQWVSRNDTHLNADLFSNPPNSQSLMIDSSKSLLTCIPGITSVKMGHQIPVLASNNTNSYQHMLLNSTHCKHSQGLAYNTASTFHPPISYHENLSPIQLSQAQSSMNLPWWLLNAKQQRKSQRPPCSCYTDPFASLHQSSMSRADIFPPPSPHHTSTINFPVCTGTISKSGVLSTQSLVQSKTATDVSSSKNKIRGGTSFNFTYLKSFDTAGRARKRAAAKDDHFVKPAKKPFFRVQEKATASAGPRQEEQMHINTMHAKIITGSNNLEVCTQNEVSRSLSLSNSLKADGGLRPGPIKLTAGAKHVLKPCQDPVQDSSRSIHATIPFSFGDNSGNVIYSQMKATEIYRF